LTGVGISRRLGEVPTPMHLHENLDWRAIERECGIPIRTTERLGEGWTATAYRVDDKVVFRFPKRTEYWEEIDREIEFLAYAHTQLPLPVPHHLLQVRESSCTPCGYCIYQYIPGRPVDAAQMSASGRDGLARTLGGFLAALHDLRPRSAELSLPHEDPYQLAMDVRADAEARILVKLSPAERGALAEIFHTYMREPQGIGRSRIVHADFSADHILHDGTRVTGIIDWGDVSLGDPDYDFSYLYVNFGEDFVRAMAGYYGHRDPERLVRKARYFMMLDQLGTILYPERALEGHVEEAWRRLRELLAAE
jgi:aminoglycoside 2''-phosphotransferase